MLIIVNAIIQCKQSHLETALHQLLCGEPLAYCSVNIHKDLYQGLKPGIVLWPKENTTHFIRTNNYFPRLFSHDWPPGAAHDQSEAGGLHWLQTEINMI